MDDPSLYPGEYHTSAVRILPPRRAFDRAAAESEFLDAALDWTLQQIGSVFSGTNDVGLASAHTRMQRAGAVLEWEIQRDAQAAKFPGPAYDDEAIAQLLAGVR